MTYKVKKGFLLTLKISPVKVLFIIKAKNVSL